LAFSGKYIFKYAGLIISFYCSFSLASSSSEKTGSPAMVFFPAAHSPKSISLQRSQQNGLNKLSSTHGTNLLQAGQLTIFA
jgi:hypothetical protein